MGIVFISMLNTRAFTAPPPTFGDREASYIGVVLAEDHTENFVRLSMSLHHAIIGPDTLPFETTAEFYTTTTTSETYLGKTLLIKGKLRCSRSPYKPHLLSGRIVRNDLKQNFINRLFSVISSYIDRLFRSLFSESNYNLATGLVLGGSSRVGKELQDVFTRAGILHILSVSGLHVGFVISFIGLILLLVPIPSKIKLIIVMSIIFIYCGITGFRPSVLRSSLMACLFAVALATQRNVSSIHILNISALLLLIINPLILFDIGAQLSFVSVYGIIYIYPRLQPHIANRVRSRITRNILLLMTVSFGAQLFVSPLLIQYFHRTQTVAVFSNVIVVPLTSLITYLLFACILLSPLVYPLAKAIAFLISLLLSALVAISKFFAALPFSSISFSLPALLSILFFMLFFQKIRKYTLYAIVAVTLLFSIASYASCEIFIITPAACMVNLRQDKTVLITRKSNIDNILSELTAAQPDYIISQDQQRHAVQSCINLPDAYHSKEVRIGNINIFLARDVRIECGNEIITLSKFEKNDRGVIHYIVTNGLKRFEFNTRARRTIIEQIAVDSQILAARLQMLF